MSYLTLFSNLMPIASKVSLHKWMKLPYEVPVGEFGVFGVVGFDVEQCGREFGFGVGDYPADDLSDNETIFEVVGN